MDRHTKRERERVCVHQAGTESERVAWEFMGGLE